MEHYKQQMKEKIKEGVAAFSERGSEGKRQEIKVLVKGIYTKNAYNMF